MARRFHTAIVLGCMGLAGVGGCKSNKNKTNETATVCEDDGDCQSGESCGTDGVCTETTGGECTLDSHCPPGEVCGGSGVCTAWSGSTCAWDATEPWAGGVVGSVEGVLLRSATITVTSDNVPYFCLVYWLPPETKAEEHMVVGTLRDGEAVFEDILSSSAHQQAACLDLVIDPDSGKPVWFVSENGNAITLEMTGDSLKRADLTESLVSDGTELAAIGDIDAFIMGRLYTDQAGIRHALIGTNGIVVYDRDGAGDWWARWDGPNWYPEHYVGGAPSYAIFDLPGIAPEPALVSYNDSLAGIWIKSGEPTGVGTPSPFAIDRAGIGSPFFGWQSAASTAEILYAAYSSAQDGSSLVMHGHRQGASDWVVSQVAETFWTKFAGAPYAPASVVLNGTDESPYLFIENTREAKPEDPFTGQPAVAGLSQLLFAWQDAGKWKSTVLAELADDSRQIKQTGGFKVGCGRPAVYFFVENPDDGVVELHLREVAP